MAGITLSVSLDTPRGSRLVWMIAFTEVLMYCMKPLSRTYSIQ